MKIQTLNPNKNLNVYRVSCKILHCRAIHAEFVEEGILELEPEHHLERGVFSSKMFEKQHIPQHCVVDSELFQRGFLGMLRALMYRAAESVMSQR